LIIPTIISDEVFKQTFEKAELAKFWQVELANDEKSLKICKDLKEILHTAFVEEKKWKKYWIGKNYEFRKWVGWKTIKNTALTYKKSKNSDYKYSCLISCFQNWDRITKFDYSNTNKACSLKTFKIFNILPA
jgi:hypothetical protein